MSDATDAVPGRVQTETGDGFDHRVRLLAVGEGEEHRGHGADVLDVSTQEQQVAGDPEELGHHDADDVDLLGHLDAGQFLDREHVRQVVHHAAEVVDTVGVRNEAVPGLTLGHLLGTTVVVTDVRYAVDDLFTVQLQDDAERTVRRRVVRAEVEEHVVLVRTGALHAPVFRLEARGFFLKLLLGQGQAERVELGGTGGEVLAQRVTFPGRRHHDAGQVRVTGKVDAVHVPHFTLVPVGVGPETGNGRHAEVALGQGDLDHYVTITLDRHQVIKHSEVGAAWQPLTLGAQTLVHAVQVIEHDVRLGQVAQEGQDFDEFGAGNPKHRHAGAGRLGGERLRAKNDCSVRRPHPGRLPYKAGCTEHCL